MSSIFVNPDAVKSCADQINTLANEIKSILNDISAQISSTESNYQSQAATDLRDKFSSMKGDLDRFESYLRKISAFLNQNVADTTRGVNVTNVANVANIQKPM